MKKIYLALSICISLTTLAQTTNIGFENGNFSGWSGYMGNNQNSNNPLVIVTGPVTPASAMNPAETSCDYFSLHNTGQDPHSGLYLQSPLGGYCARLGGENRNIGYTGTFNACDTTASHSTNNTAGEVLQTTFTVTKASSLLQYAFAFTYLDDGSHPYGAQPYFKVEVLDSASNAITCLGFVQQGLNGTAPPGYITDGSFNYYTPNWVINYLDLVSYMGHKVTLKFTVAGCILTAHYGYVYLDCRVIPTQISFQTPPCIGSNIALTAPNPVASYTWSGPGIVSGVNSYNATVNQSGTYSVAVSDYNGCPAYIVDTTITFNPTPTLTVNSPSVCTGNTVTITASGANTFSWSTTETTASIAVSPTITTTYSVTGTDVNGCIGKDTSQVLVTSCSTTAINKLALSNYQANIYPNPSNGTFVVEPNSHTNQTMQLFDIAGKQVLSQTITGKTTIDASTLPQGVYYINISGIRGSINKKLVIVK
ncbi:MAG TPA: T9SS type A sorting domain-containing protein [Bacteroidia bacterium]|nr:T9SS type A sorting domain-containing protein [Bacteroidia bacterium]